METHIKNIIFGGFSIVKHIMIVAASACLSLVIFAAFINPVQSRIANQPATHTVTIYQMKFDPAHLEVKKGDKVVWINKDFVPHDVTEEINKKWTSKPLQKGEKWSKVINEDIAYYCSIHQVMKGTITVSK